MPIIFEFYEYSNENNFEDLSLCSLRYLEISHRAYSKDWKYFVPREYNYSPIVNLELVLYLCWSELRRSNNYDDSLPAALRSVAYAP